MLGARLNGLLSESMPASGLKRALEILTQPSKQSENCLSYVSSENCTKSLFLDVSKVQIIFSQDSETLLC